MQVYVDLTDQLLLDLETAIDELAFPLLSTTDSTTLTHRFDLIWSKWLTAKDNFVNQPNAADTALGALISQLQELQEDNAGVDYEYYTPDVNNIQDEIETRSTVAIFVIDERLRQSVPLSGF